MDMTQLCEADAARRRHRNRIRTQRGTRLGGVAAGVRESGVRTNASVCIRQLAAWRNT
jgi:hypothetical protein